MTERELFQEAIAARKHAYAPYSGFYVGAAIETIEGVVWGCNIENSSYSMTICAERVAIFRTVADGKHYFKRIAIAGGKDNSNAENSPCFPVVLAYRC